MEFFGVGNTDIFSATIQQTGQLESLANGALSKGIDLYMRQDYETVSSFVEVNNIRYNSLMDTISKIHLAGILYISIFFQPIR